MKIHEAVALKESYGNITLDELVSHLMGDNKHKCPKCDGKGTESYTYNAYPSGLPDSGYVEDMKIGRKTCTSCKGIGYTDRPLKPKMVQMGWE